MQFQALRIDALPTLKEVCRVRRGGGDDAVERLGWMWSIGQAEESRMRLRPKLQQA